MPSVFHSNSPEETEAVGARVAAQAYPGLVIAFTGDLGAGKTAFCRGFLRQLGYTGRVTSPTFAIVNEYDTAQFRVCHFDMYRILDEDMLYDIGWDDYLAEGATIAVEWAENESALMPDDAVSIAISGSGEEPREIQVTNA